MSPTVSIGMPVYNERTYVRAAIESVLSQSYDDFELLISDNASDDGTSEICDSYAALDGRITYVRHERNKGAIFNFNFTLSRSVGRYFMWLGGHDKLPLGFLEQATRVLDRHPSVVLAYGKTVLIDTNDAELGILPEDYDTVGLPPHLRFVRIMWALKSCSLVYGLFRGPIIRKIRVQPVWGPDHLILADMALRGEFRQIDHVGLYRRDVRELLSGAAHKQRVARAILGTDFKTMVEHSDIALYRCLRDAHVRLVLGSTLPVPYRIWGALSTLLCFDARFGVPLMPGYFGRCARRALLATGILSPPGRF